MIQVFTCLSQMIVIFIFISIVNCKNGWTVYEEKPSCINLNHTSGGLGNQLFSILSVVSRAHQLGVNYTLPIHQLASRGYVSSPVYWGSPMLANIIKNAKALDQCKPVVASWQGQQFEHMPVTLPWLQEGSVRVHGMLMSTLDIFNSSSYLRDLLVTNTGLEWKKQHNTTHNLLVGFRSFSEEKRSEWSTHISYYGKALKNLQRPNQAIHIFGDEGVHDFAKLIASMLVYNQQIYIYKGERHNVSMTEQHLQFMMQCDDFVLCNSSFHIWGALLSNKTSKVTFHGGWLDNLEVPSWCKIDGKYQS